MLPSVTSQAIDSVIVLIGGKTRMSIFHVNVSYNSPMAGSPSPYSYSEVGIKVCGVELCFSTNQCIVFICLWEHIEV